MNIQNKNVKFDFYNTSTVTSTANVILSIFDMDVSKKMESGKAPFKVETFDGTILNNIAGFRVRVSLFFETTLEPDLIVDLANYWYTYYNNVNYEIRLYPNWDNDTTNYIVCSLENEIEDLTQFKGTILTQNVPTLGIIEKTRRTSIPAFLEGV